MSTISYTLEPMDVWLSQLSQMAPSILKGNRLELLPQFGSGSMQTVQLQEGLSVAVTDVILNQAIVLHRKAKPINDGFVLNIYLSNSKVVTTINDTNIDLGVEKSKVILSSSTSSAELIFPSHIPLKIFHIYLSRTWLLENAVSEKSVLYEPVVADKQLHMIEQLDYNFNKVKELIIPLLASQNKLKLMSIVFQVLEHLIVKLEKRINPVFIPIHAKDLVSLEQAIDTIESNATKVSSNEQLAKQCGMSLSKFKNLFKHVYGITPYQYYLEYKLNLAFELLKTRQYSVSEVGFLIGYKNMGQFSKRFYKQHQILPSEVA